MANRWAHEEFTFISDRHWEKIPNQSDDGRLQLFCPETGTSLALSMEAMDIPKNKIESVAKSLMEARKFAHVRGIQDMMQSNEVPDLQFVEEHIGPNAGGNGYEVVYEGSLPGKNFFGFLGFVSQRKIFNLIVVTPFSYAKGHAGMFREVAGGFSVVLP